MKIVARFYKGNKAIYTEGLFLSKPRLALWAA